MKKYILPVFTVALIIINLGLLSFKPANTGKQYQHMIIIAEHRDIDDVRVCIDGKIFRRLQHLNKQIQGVWDMNPVINVIHEYEADGWELQSFEGNGEFHNFWLRKEK